MPDSAPTVQGFSVQVISGVNEIIVGCYSSATITESRAHITWIEGDLPLEPPPERHGGFPSVAAFTSKLMFQKRCRNSDSCYGFVGDISAWCMIFFGLCFSRGHPKPSFWAGLKIWMWWLLQKDWHVAIFAPEILLSALKCLSVNPLIAVGFISELGALSKSGVSTSSCSPSPSSSRGSADPDTTSQELPQHLPPPLPSCQQVQIHSLAERHINPNCQETKHFLNFNEQTNGNKIQRKRKKETKMFFILVFCRKKCVH